VHDRRYERLRSAAPLASIAAIILSSACARQGNAPSGQIIGPDRCVVRETSRTPLAIDGNRELYVEPTVVSPSGGRILLAGRPNYLFSPGAPTEERSVSRDSVFGAVLDARGRARLVPSPIDPALVASARALPLEGGRWALVFGELKHPWEPPRSDTIARLWYGEFDGTTWSALEELPHVSGGVIELEMGSALVRRADTLFVAAAIRTDTGSRSIALFERRAGRWSLEIVNTLRAVAYVELVYSDSLGLLVAVVQGDPSLSRDSNSLLLYGNRPRWEIIRRVLHGGAQPVYDPLFGSSSEGTVLSWWVVDREGQPAARHARAMVGLTEARDGRVVELDPDITHVVPVFRRSAFPVWVAEHNTLTGSRELRFVAESFGVPRELASLPSPFTGPFAATAVGGSELLVSGPLFHADAARPRLVSLLIRATVECSSSAP
jgi:hypothetical protein